MRQRDPPSRVDGVLGEAIELAVSTPRQVRCEPREIEAFTAEFLNPLAASCFLMIDIQDNSGTLTLDGDKVIPCRRINRLKDLQNCGCQPCSAGADSFGSEPRRPGHEQPTAAGRECTERRLDFRVASFNLAARQAVRRRWRARARPWRGGRDFADAQRSTSRDERRGGAARHTTQGRRPSSAASRSASPSSRTSRSGAPRPRPPRTRGLLGRVLLERGASSP